MGETGGIKETKMGQTVSQSRRHSIPVSLGTSILPDEFGMFDAFDTFDTFDEFNLHTHHPTPPDANEPADSDFHCRVA
jgi:hypothetical protein